MLARFSLATMMVLISASDTFGQGSAPTWRRAGQDGIRTASRSAADTPSSPTTLTEVPRNRSVAQAITGDGTLPNRYGQVWREYDISPYTTRVTTTKRPEQAIIDWILRETGYEIWHGEPLGVLSATGRTLRVYHTPEIQSVVADIVDRFVTSEDQSGAFGLRIVTVQHPNWRVRARPLLDPVDVQTPGSSAWLMAKEDAAVLLSELRRRSDFREHTTPHLSVNNGESTVVSSMRGRKYLRELVLRPNVAPGYEVALGQVDEGFSLEFAPLLSADSRLIDATIQCEINQVEKLVSVVLDVPTATTAGQRATVQVPQVTQFRFHERFRWPADKVLLVELGVVAMPGPDKRSSLIPGLKLPGGNAAPRGSMLVFIQGRKAPGEAARTARRTGRNVPDATRRF